MSVIINGDTGITSPAETVQGALTTTGNTILGDATTDTLTVGVTGIVKDASGNVGIGTASPSGKLDVAYGDYQVAGAIRIGADLGTSGARTNNTRKFGAITSVHYDNAEANLVAFVMDSQSNSVSYLNIGGGSSSFNSPSSTSFYTSAAGITDGIERMRIDSSGNLLFNSGYGSAATAYGCRAWVNFNGTGTVAIRASGNVSSITDNGTGDYTVNFTTAMPDANYSTVGAAGVVGTGLMGSWFTANRDQTTGSTVNPTTSAVRVGALTSYPTPSAVDCPHMLVSIFR